MTAPPLRIMFLGNRRIAWEILKLLSSGSCCSDFDIRAIVSDEKIWRAYEALKPSNDVSFISSKDRHSELIFETIQAQSIHILLSIQYNWILPAQVLDLVGRRAYNLHNAKLPEYKGYHSISHAIANQDSTYHTTIHHMADEVDSGDVAYISETLIRENDTAQSLYLRTVDAAILCVKNLLHDLAAGMEIPRYAMANRVGAFYDRQSINALADVTDKVNAKQLAHVSRATFFPPNNTAHFFYAGQKYLVVPEDEAEKLFYSGGSVNEPQI